MFETRRSNHGSTRLVPQGQATRASCLRPTQAEELVTSELAEGADHDNPTVNLKKEPMLAVKRLANHKKADARA